MTLNDLQRAAVVLFAAREVGPNGSLDQMKAVCHVIRNQVAAGWYEDYLAAVEGTWRRKRYTELGETQPPLDSKDRRLGMLARDVDDIFYGGASDDIARLCGRQDKEHGPLLYWCFVDRPVTAWFTENVVRKPEEHFQRGIVGFMYLYE
jgi:hypothetical protein